MISLVEFDLSFVELSWNWLRDDEIRKLTRTPTFTKEEQLEWYYNLKNKTDYRIWGAKVDNQSIGVFGLKKITKVEAEYWGYIGCKEYWGNGLGRSFIGLVLDYARSVLKLSCVYLNVGPDNARAIKAYRGIGFKIQEQQSDNIKMYFFFKTQIVYD